MRYTLAPGTSRLSVNFIDNIVYSKARADLKGCDVELKLSLMIQNGNSEMRTMGWTMGEPKPHIEPKPVVLWIPGGGFRGADKNLMTCEMEFLAEAGYAVASIYYRSSAEALFPAQLVDVKSAIRFLRANAEKYNLDGSRIAVIGRSAGGHLAAFAAMNTPGYDEGDYLDVSSEVQCACDMFGPVNFINRLKYWAEKMEGATNFRFKTLLDCHEGAVLGALDDETARAASPVFFVNDKMCPMLILHGDSDSGVPPTESEGLYENICKAGLEDRCDFYLLKGADHGTDEFFQPVTKEVILKYFDRYMK